MTLSRSTPPPPEERGSRVMRFGAAVSAVLLACVLATVPAGVRITRLVSGSPGTLGVFVALLALVFVPLAVATTTLRRALAALRLFDSASAASGIMTAVVWAISSFVLLGALGAALRATTHHHGLAGVTFAIAGSMGALILAAFGTRFVTWAHATAPSARAIVGGAGAVFLTLGLAFFARQFGRSEVASAYAVDLVSFSFATAFGAGAFPLRSRPFAPLAFAGPPLAAVVLALGVGTLRESPTLRATIAEAAPVLATALPLVGEPVGTAAHDAAH
jgi:hypothetical protein